MCGDGWKRVESFLFDFILSSKQLPLLLMLEAMEVKG